ncbi:MAG: hypothetical protein ACYTG5_00415 [Planctomycetota bacterium]
MPLALGISASETLSCALRHEGHIYTRSAEPGTRSAGKLANFVAMVLDEASCAAKEITELRMDIGPGSYTGLRAAIAFAQMAAGFGQARLLTTTSSEIQVVAAFDAELVQKGDLVLTLRAGTAGRILCTELHIEDEIRVRGTTRALDNMEAVRELPEDRAILTPRGMYPGVASALTGTSSRVLQAPEYGAPALFSSLLSPRVAEVEGLEPLYLMGSYAG